MIGRRNFLLISAGFLYESFNNIFLHNPLEKYSYKNGKFEPKFYKIMLKEFSNLSLIGEKYRKKYPDESSKDKMLQILQGNSSHVNNSNFIKVLRQKIDKDLENCQTVIIDGWLISKTEARISALIYLIYKNVY